MPKTGLGSDLVLQTAAKLEGQAFPRLADIKERIRALSPELQSEIDELLQPERINDMADLKEVTLFFFRHIMSNDIPFRMSGEIRAWCRDLLPILMAARNPMNIGQGLTINNTSNTLLQIIQKGEQGEQDQIVTIEGPPQLAMRPIATTINAPPITANELIIDFSDFGDLE